MNLSPVSVQDRFLFPYFPDRAEILRRSGEHASALPIGSSRTTKDAGVRR